MFETKYEAAQALTELLARRKDVEAQARIEATRAREDFLRPYRTEVAELMRDAKALGLRDADIRRIYGSSAPYLVRDHLALLEDED